MSIKNSNGLEALRGTEEFANYLEIKQMRYPSGAAHQKTLYFANPHATTTEMKRWMWRMLFSPLIMNSSPGLQISEASVGSTAVSPNQPMTRIHVFESNGWSFTASRKNLSRDLRLYYFPPKVKLLRECVDLPLHAVCSLRRIPTSEDVRSGRAPQFHRVGAWRDGRWNRPVSAEIRF